MPPSPPLHILIRAWCVYHRSRGTGAGFVSKYIPLVKGKEKGSKVNPVYLGISVLACSPATAYLVTSPPPSPLYLPAELTSFTNDNIKGFNSYVPLPAYIEMLKKPQCEPSLPTAHPACACNSRSPFAACQILSRHVGVPLDFDHRIGACDG